MRFLQLRHERLPDGRMSAVAARLSRADGGFVRLLDVCASALGKNTPEMRELSDRASQDEEIKS